MATTEGTPLAGLAPAQIQELQRVFYSIDKDADGRINEADVAGVLRNLGASDAAAEAQACFAPPTPASLESLSFLTHMSQILAPFSDADKLLEAFASFDEKDEGVVDVAELEAVVGDRALVRG